METKSLSDATHHGKDALWNVRPKAFSEKGLKRTVKQVMLPMVYVPVITHRPIQSALCKSGQFNAKGHI